MTKLQVDEDNGFEFCFKAFCACISGFHTCCRLAITIDGIHLKGKYKGNLFIITSIEGNEHIFPIALGVENIENDRSWT